MKLKDLIKELSELNPESTILFSNSIECFRSVSVCSYLGDYSINSYTKNEFKEELEDSFEDNEQTTKEELLESIDGEEVVVFSINGEETYSE